MLKIIKEFIAFRKITKAIEQMEFSNWEKVEIEKMNRELIKRIWTNVINSLSNEMINWNLSVEYIRGFKHWASMYTSVFRKYFK